MDATARNPYREGYRYREAFFNLLAQDFKIKYRRTFLGYAWSLLNPLIYVGVMTVVFSHVVRVKMKDYALFLFSGWIVWSFLQGALMAATNCLTENEGFIRKIYVPKILFPLSRVSLKAVEFLLTLVSLLFIGLFMGFPIRTSWFALPPLCILLFLFTFGLSVTIAFLYVFFRDAQYLLAVGLQLFYFATPIIYPIDLLPANYHIWEGFNPFYALLLPFQQILYHGVFPSPQDWSRAATWALASCLLGTWVLIKWDDEVMFRL